MAFFTHRPAGKAGLRSRGTVLRISPGTATAHAKGGSPPDTGNEPPAYV